MLRFIKQKIKNQLWLTLCLILGISLLAASFCCRPMFMTGALDRLLQQMFVKYIEDNNEYPTIIGKTAEYHTNEILSAEENEQLIQQNRAIWEKYLTGIDIVSSQSIFSSVEEVGESAYAVKGSTYKINYIPELIEHIDILKGTDYENADRTVLPCIIAEKTMDNRGLVIGEEISFTRLTNQNGEKLKLIVVGIFREKDNSDLFWYKAPNGVDRDVYVDDETYDIMINEYQEGRTLLQNATYLNYEDINSGNIDIVNSRMKAFAENDEDFFCSFSPLIEEFLQQRKMVGIMLWVLELPILGMVLAFIYMLSNQIADSEKSEIAALRSRGISRLQVIWIYTIRLSIISIFSCVLGIPMGYGFCKLAASTTDFLTFSGNNAETYTFVPQMIYDAGMAALIGIIFMLIPVIRCSKVTIVECKSSYNQGKPMFWEKYYLDIVLLALSLYLWFSSSRSIDNLRENAMAGSKLDPLIFLNTCLFIVSAGMVAFRLMHYLVKLVYSIRKKKWKSVSYVAFLQITRTFRKQTFITIFMVLTVSLGLFNANAARTINRNNEDRIQYETGSDIRLQESWMVHYFKADDDSIKIRYIEPDYNKYLQLVEKGYCESVTKVITYANTAVQDNGSYSSNCTVMGIDSKDFGETAYLKPDLYGNNHWYNSLNKLASDANNCIISSNLADKLNVQIGDIINFNGMKTFGKDDSKTYMYCNIVDIVEAWPGFERFYYEDTTEKERCLLVVNQATMVQHFDITPYDIWLKQADGMSAEMIYQHLLDENIKMLSYDSIENKTTVMKDLPKIQITNGMFTLSFMIALGLCGVGFLIYWIASIRQRELLFGVYRAMGLSVRNINSMLIYEHLFSTVLSVLAGGAVGMAATLLFIKLFGVVYLPEKSNLDIYIYYETGDIVKLFSIIALVIIVCLLILRRLVKRMNITQALKLGED